MPRPGSVVVELVGEHDAFTQGRVEEVLVGLTATYELVVVDVSQTEFMDSSTIRNVFYANRVARERGTWLRLQIGENAVVRRTLEIGQALDLFDHVATREEALKPPPVGDT